METTSPGALNAQDLTYQVTISPDTAKATTVRKFGCRSLSRVWDSKRMKAVAVLLLQQYHFITRKVDSRKQRSVGRCNFAFFAYVFTDCSKLF